MKINGEPLEKWLPKFMDHYKKMCYEIDQLKELRGKILELQGLFLKLEKDLFGLKAIIPDDKLDAYELGREDKAIAEKVDGQLKSNEQEKMI